MFFPRLSPPYSVSPPPLSARAPLPTAGYLYPQQLLTDSWALGGGDRDEQAKMTGWWAVLSLLAGRLGRASSPSPGEARQADRGHLGRGTSEGMSKAYEPGAGRQRGWDARTVPWLAFSRRGKNSCGLIIGALPWGICGL